MATTPGLPPKLPGVFDMPEHQSSAAQMVQKTRSKTQDEEEVEERVILLPKDPEDCVSLMINNFVFNLFQMGADKQSAILMRLGERGMVRLVPTAITQTRVLNQMVPFATDAIEKSRQYLHDTLRTITKMSTYLPAAKKLGQVFKELLPALDEVISRAAQILVMTGHIDRALVDFPFRLLHNIIVAAPRRDVLQPFCDSKCYDRILVMFKCSNFIVLYYVYRIILYTVEMGTDGEREKFRTGYIGEDGDKLLSIGMDKLSNREKYFPQIPRPVVENVLTIAKLIKGEIETPRTAAEYFSIRPKKERLIREGPYVEVGLVFSQAPLPVICSRKDCRKQEESGKLLKVCARCLLARYCSVECQKLHWKNGHKGECFTKEDLLKEI